MKKHLLFILLGGSLLYGETLQRGEFFIDSDPGEGSATAIANVSGADFSREITISAASLSLGVHLLGVRFQDAEEDWSQTVIRPFALSGTTNSVFSRGEYFLNTDPGEGNGITIPIAANSSSFESQLQIPASALDASFPVNLLGVRFQDSEGNWSQTIFRPFTIALAQAPALARGEYFFNADPGVGMATSLGTIEGTSLDTQINIGEAALANLPTGVNLLGVRFQDEEGQWGQTVFRVFANSGPVGSAIQTVLWTLHRDRMEISSGQIDGDGATRLNLRRRAALDPLTLGDNLLLEVQVIDEIGNPSQKVFRELTIGSFDEDFLTQNFTTEERNDPSISGDLADPDGDGLSNLLEQALGLNPRDSAEGAEGTALLLDDDGFGFQFFAPAEAVFDAMTNQFQLAGLSYQLMVSDDLNDWRLATSPEDFQFTQMPAEGEDALVRHRVELFNNSVGKNFYQLLITRP